jgi:hypothetical protein
MILKIMIVLCLIELALIILGTIAFFIYRGIIKASALIKDNQIAELKAKVVQYHEASLTLFASLKLLKYYENVDMQTQLIIDKIADDINQYTPYYNNFVSDLKKRQEEEQNVLNVEANNNKSTTTQQKKEGFFSKAFKKITGGK